MSSRKSKIQNKKPLFEVRDSGIQGKGVFALRKIRRGTRLIEYTGELISTDEESDRYDDEAMDRHHTFLFEIDDEYTIDGAVGGSDARFINHSCDPNCEAVNEDNHIFIEALQTIEPGEELLYDYGYEHDEPISDEMKKRYPCHCGAKNCRGTILKYVSPD